jgi:heme-degrading monooxygenase HmoA
MTVAVVFTSRRTPTHDDEYGPMSARMVALVQEQPGFIRMSSVRDPESREGITVAWFEDEESVRAWRAHPDHQEAQRRGIADFYEHYEVTVATVVREYGGTAG